jgi:hypothetical protein
MRGEAVEVELIDREFEGLVGVPPLTACGIFADQHVVEPQQHHSLAGRWLGREDDVDMFVGIEVVELDLKGAGDMRFVTLTVTV